MLQLRSGFGLFNKAPAYSAHSYVSNHPLITKRSGIALAGVFILAAALEVIGLSMHATGAQGTTNNSSQSAKATSANVQANPSSNAIPGTPALSESESGSNNDVSTNVQSTTDEDGNTSTHVMVNGRPVNVPDNGSTTNTIATPGGTTTYMVSNNRDSQGSSTNTSTSTSSLNVSSSSSSKSNSSSSTSIQEHSSP